jgi:hypothetical protein
MPDIYDTGGPIYVNVNVHVSVEKNSSNTVGFPLAGYCLTRKRPFFVFTTTEYRSFFKFYIMGVA